MSLLYQMRLDSPAGLWPLDEASGTTAFDRSGNGRDGTYNGTLTRQTRFGPMTGVTLAGNSGYVSGPNLGTSVITTGITHEIWLWLDSLPTISDATVLVDNGMAYMWMNASGQIVGYDFKGGSNGARGASTALATGRLYHVVTAVSVSAGTHYIDGVAAGTFTPIASGSNWADANTGSGVMIGSEGGTTRPFVAKAAMAAIYPSVLSAARIKAHYEAGIRGGVIIG